MWMDEYCSMKIVCIRHGEPDKSKVEERGFIGHGRDLAPLSQKGIEQAESVSFDPVLSGAELIVSSPYTRALQTAAIISRNTGIKINVELDIHEFIPDKTFRIKTLKEDELLHAEFIRFKGSYPSGAVCKWETIDEMIGRIKPVFDRYVDAGYQKIIVVAHGGIIRRLTGKTVIDHAEVSEIDYCKEFTYHGWI